MGEFPHILASFPCPWTLWIPRLNVKVDYITVRWWRLSTFKGTFSCGPQMPVHSHSFFWKSILVEQLKKKFLFWKMNPFIFLTEQWLPGATIHTKPSCPCPCACWEAPRDCQDLSAQPESLRFILQDRMFIERRNNKGNCGQLQWGFNLYYSNSNFSSYYNILLSKWDCSGFSRMSTEVFQGQQKVVNSKT